MTNNTKKKIRTGSVYIFNASGWDRFDRHLHTPKDGTLVRVTKAPYGCPKNGTMGHCYVSDMEGNFIGLVAEASLLRFKK